MDLSVEIGALRLSNPLIAASGCYGTASNTLTPWTCRRWGLSLEGLFLAPREGTPAADRRDALRHAERDRTSRHRRAPLHRREASGAATPWATNIINICGSTSMSMSSWRESFHGAGGVHALELNISCPNIKEGGIVRLQPSRHVRRRQRCQEVTHLPVIPKLTPNVTDVASIAKAAEDAGADAVSLVNTFLAMAIDVETRRPKLSNIVGGLSGPAIRPIAVRMVRCRRAVKIPVRSAWEESQPPMMRWSSSSRAQQRYRLARPTSSTPSSGRS